MDPVPTRILAAIAAGVVLSVMVPVAVAGPAPAPGLEQLLDRVREDGEADTVEAARAVALGLPSPTGRASALRELAGIQAGRGDHQGALATLAGAREVLEAHPGEVGVERALVLELEGSLLQAVGRSRDSLEVLELALAERRGRGDAVAAATVLNQIASGLFYLGEYEQCSERAYEALQTAGTAGAPGVAARARFLLGFVQRQLERYEPALELFRAAAADAERAGDLGQQQRAVNEEANVLYFLERSDEAIARKRDALALAQAAGDAFGRASCEHDMGALLYQAGDVEGALAAFRSAHETFLRLGSLREASASASNVAGMLSAVGRLRDAVEWSERAVELARQGDLPAEEELALTSLATALAGLGEHRRAFEVLSEAHALGQRTLRAETARTIEDLEARYEAERRHAELEHERQLQEIELARQHARRRMWFGAFVAAAAVLGLVTNQYRLKARAHRQITRANVELEAARDRLAELARTDELTGLANRREAESRLVREALRFDRSGHPFSLLLVDVDRFKRVNDVHGHEVGDRVLNHLAGALRTSTRTLDLPAREGGEEFLVVLPETDSCGARTVAENVRSRLAVEPCTVDGAPLPVTVTIGVAGYAGEGVAECVRRADEALYAGKRAGRDRVVVAREPDAGA